MDGIQRQRTNSIDIIEFVDLGDILNAFSAPFNEEQAWGLCYQCAIWMRGALRREGKPWLACVSLNGVSDLLLFKDGQVKLKLQSGLQKGGPALTEHKLVQLLGKTIYSGLDYGLGEEEERVLSEPLENLITQMTFDTGDEDNSLNADEGIVDGHETDSCEEGEEKIETLHQVIKFCSKHVSSSSDPSSHYQAVCRALYSEVAELKTFLGKISSSKEILRKLAEERNSESVESHIEDLRPQEWGRIWIQVLRDLRQGIRLKKVERRMSISIEYELTPYEILMDDIRSKRYSLNKVMMNDSIPPRVKKEAHDIILDFIRSRPPLRKVPEEERERSRGESQHEKVMKEIRSKPKLKPASERKLPNRKPKRKKKKRDETIPHGDESSSSGSEYDYSYLDSPTSVRKKIDPGITFSWSASETETENDTEEEECFSPDGLKFDAETERRLLNLSGCLEGALDISPTHSSVSSFEEIQSIDFCMDTPRRHSVSLCQLEPWWKPFEDNLQEGEATKYLSLSVDEVIHIRSVLVKAELENMRINPNLLEAVINEKVCFSCKKKFTLFGRKCRCRLCSRQVCSICCSKMFVPDKTFLSFPVEALSPTSSPKRSPSRMVRKTRSLSEPPTPNLTPQPSPLSVRKLVEQESTRKEDVCNQCREFLRHALRSETRGGLPTSPSFDEELQTKIRFQLPVDHR